jgi:hypothetical protein
MTTETNCDENTKTEMQGTEQKKWYTELNISKAFENT